MENKQNGTTKGGSVYITVDKFFNPVHISMKGTGEEGYQEFMQEDVEKALKSGEMPDMGLMYYNVPDMGIVPPLEEGDNEDYLKRLEKAMDEHGIILQRYQRLSEVVVSLIIPAEKQYPLVRLNTRIELIPVLQIIQHIRHRYG